MSRRQFKRTVSRINKKEGSSINFQQSISTPNTAASVKLVCTEEMPSSNETLYINNFNLDPQPGKLDIFTNDNNTCSNNVNNLYQYKSFQLIENDGQNNCSLQDKLSQLIAKYHISHNCVNELLVILRSEGLDVPKDVRSLLKTPKSKSHNIIQMDNGSYIHIGIEQMIKPILYTYFNSIKDLNLIQLSVHVDGLSISDSSKSSFWPILISFINVLEINKIVIPVGIFHSRSKKPGSVHYFFDPFITEMKSIFENGIEIKQKLFHFSISQIVCDAPAKAFVLNVKYFNAYHSCNSCLEEGEFISRRMSFLGIDSQLRTNESFRSKSDDSYHKGSCPFEIFPIDMTSVFVLDYMHNVCQGVMKRLLYFWKSGQKPVRFLNTDLEHQISTEQVNFQPHFPSEFSRLPRSLDELEFWKATEYRTFLLYTGPILLKGRIKSSLYNHFLLLHCAIKILIFVETCLIYNDLANNLLRKFVTEYPEHYGNEYVTYNVHGLVHIANFVKIHGRLDNFSAFKFENCLQIIKKTVHSSKYPLQDVYNRILEQNMYLENNIKYPILKKEINFNYTTHQDITTTLYEQVLLKNFKVSCTKEHDKYFFLFDCCAIVSIEKIIKDSSGHIMLEATKYENLSPMFNSPISSHLIGHFLVNTEIKIAKCLIELSNLKYKCLFFHTSENQAVALNLLHTE